MIYRRRRHSDVWHWMRTCRWWPAKNYNVDPAEQYSKPRSGELCNECLAKNRKEKP